MASSSVDFDGLLTFSSTRSLPMVLPTTLSWDELLDDLLVGFGVSPSGIPKVWTKLPKEVLQTSRADVDSSKVVHASAVRSILDLYKGSYIQAQDLES